MKMDLTGHVCVAVVVALCMALGGCSHATRYHLAIQPQEEGFQRTLTVENASKELVAQLLNIYQQQPEEGDFGKRFSHQFDAIPQDIEGTGTWANLHSPMGWLYAYVERFGGNDDLVGQVEARLVAADRLTDLLISWLEMELHDDERWDVLHQFCDQTLRRDLKNISLYIMQETTASEDEQATGALLSRIGQYLIDRQYLSVAELEQLVIDMVRMNQEEKGSSILCALLQRQLAQRMGLEKHDDIPQALDFLASPKSALKSFERFIESPGYRDRIAAWWLLETPQEDKEPNYEQAMSAIIEQFFGVEWELFSEMDTVDLSLNCPQEPLFTNGIWDAKAGQLTWSDYLRKQYGLPTMFYAFWTQPDQAYQSKHLGGVFVGREQLAQYIIIYHSLFPEDKAVWNKVLENLNPDQDIQKQMSQMSWDVSKPRTRRFTELRDLIVSSLPTTEVEAP